MRDDTADQILALRLVNDSLRLQLAKLAERVEALEKRARSAAPPASITIASPVLAQAVAEVAAETGLPQDAIIGRSRHDAVCQARQRAFLLAHQRGLSASEIARRMGRDHSTVLHGIRAAQSRMEATP